MALHALHLCSGYGGFELALRIAGIDALTVAHVERDSHAASVLVARMAEARLDHAPVWDDVRTFDGTAWRGCVDIITAGFPCQPFSVAGQKLGTDDERWIWPDISRIVAEVGPRYLILENVPGVVRAGLGRVLGDVAFLGFDAEWGVLPASAIGAPHQRERFWLLGYPGGARGREVARELHGDASGDQPEHGDLVAGPGEDVAVTDGAGFKGVGHDGGRWILGRDPDGSGGSLVAYTAGERGVSRDRPAARRWWPLASPAGEHAWPPYPNDEAGWRVWGGAQPSIRRGADGATEWLADELHLGGNGLVPQCAAAAIHLLIDRIDIQRGDHDAAVTDLDNIFGGA